MYPRRLKCQTEVSANYLNLRHYTEQFGQKAGDLAFVAEDESQVVGAAWVRHIHDYGYV
ncbi:hypothetical protein [Streptococcus sp.]|uniref:hypothetical protein n=1 Tax=Streptococcus sp. TaxID=1306 RepID=UPI00391C64D5